MNVIKTATIAVVLSLSAAGCRSHKNAMKETDVENIETEYEATDTISAIIAAESHDEIERTEVTLSAPAATGVQHVEKIVRTVARRASTKGIETRRLSRQESRESAAATTTAEQKGETKPAISTATIALITSLLLIISLLILKQKRK